MMTQSLMAEYDVSSGKVARTHLLFIDWVVHHGTEFLPTDGIVFDRGANVGLLSLVFAKVVAPQGIVFAFEPDDENLVQFKKNIGLNELENIVAIDSAVQADPARKIVSFHIRRAVGSDHRENRVLWSKVDLKRSFPC